MSKLTGSINQNFLDLPSFSVSIDSEEFFIRKFGAGPNLVFIHGFFVSGYTWRFVLPFLSKFFTCYIIDTPGFGKSRWHKKSELSFTALSVKFEKLFKKLDLSSFSIVAQDTGASIMRLVLMKKGVKPNKVILINTEIPNHRPPFIQLHQFFARLPLSNQIFRILLKLKFVVRSKILINQFYSNKSLLKSDAYIKKYLDDLSTKQGMDGMLKYLIGIDWEVVDSFITGHSEIDSDVLLIWGSDDKTFPIELARSMKNQFKSCDLIEVKNASLMPHEEQPETVAECIKNFILQTEPLRNIA